MVIISAASLHEGKTEALKVIVFIGSFMIVDQSPKISLAIGIVLLSVGMRRFWSKAARAVCSATRWPLVPQLGSALPEIVHPVNLARAHGDARALNAKPHQSFSYPYVSSASLLLGQGRARESEAPNIPL